MRRLASIAALALAACGGPPPASRSDHANEAGATTTNPAPAPRPSRQIGSVSGLSGAASGLKGLVSGFQVRQTATQTVVSLAADTLFAFDQSAISPEAAANLRRTADLVRQGGAGAVKVVGHSDGKGDDRYNDALSQRRAQAVADWLSNVGGMSEREFDVAGRGKRDPVAPNAQPDGSDDPAGRARNRRVEVIIPRA